MRLLDFALHIKFPPVPLAAAPDCSPALRRHQHEGVHPCVQRLFSLFPFSVSDSTQRRRLGDRSRLQPRLWLDCQSHMRREGGECGQKDRNTHNAHVFSRTYYLDFPHCRCDGFIWKCVFFSFCTLNFFPCN